ncbi:MAG: tRNA-dihydrouridine synthase family protein, partial [Draconibacterium sp.]|nr:tRNA-dihydrouridine synthase family protein [Draconibacterium sp.]
MIYLAPIQGFTDFVYRKAYSLLFPEVDKYFIPYISVKNNQILKKYENEILLQNNPQKRVIPQVLAKDFDELQFLSTILKNAGYNEINLNLGCPYPMVTNRGKGAGLLPHPEKLKAMLASFFEKSNLKLSIKLRAGLNSPKEIESIITVLNSFPLTEIIFHPRIAKQLYKGEIIDTAFQLAIKNLNHKLVYNGNIFSLSDFEKRKEQFPKIDNWMLGRGILMNPFLPAEINQVSILADDKIDKLKEFHQLIFEGYSETMDNTGNVLNKMKQFWSYFSYSFPNQKKVFKSVKKSKNLGEYNVTCQKAFFS